MADESRPATYDEVIADIATKHGVPPELARAVAERESGFDPKAIGKPVNGKQARGIFQLMPDTATELGVTDPHDPIQNITGGIKYLKQLQDKYEGDPQQVQKMLQGYNGGPRHVDEGNVSADAQAYATEIMSKMMRQTAKGAPQVAGAGGPGVTAAATPEAPEAPKKGLLRRGVEAVASSVNPMTPEGREGIGGVAGGTIGGVITGGNPLGAAAGAMLGGQAAGLVNQVIAPAPSLEEGARAVRNAGFEQGAYEAGGQVVGRGLARIGRAALGTAVGQAAKNAAETGLETARGAYKTAIEAAKSKFGTAVKTAEETAREAKEVTRVAGEAHKETVKAAGAEAVSKAKQTAEAATETAKKSAAEKNAAADLEAESLRKSAEVPHQELVANPPSRETLTETNKAALGGLPGLHTEPTGPVKQALDIAGKHIEEVASQGPAVDVTGLKEAVRKMAGEAWPKSIFQGETKGAQAIGFRRAASAPARMAAAAKGLTPVERVAYEQKLAKAIGQQLGLPPAHPLPGLLAKIEASPDKLSFADAHQFKTLLDKAVTWDRTAKSAVEGVTKGARVELRKVLGDFAPYNAATKAYQDVIGLYRGKGAGPEFIRAVTNNPDRLATILKSGKPEAAEAVKKLLVEQSTKGGDAAAGQRAWEAVRANHTYENLILGKPEQLGQRVADLVSQRPEFVKVVYGDQFGKEILSNLETIGKGITQATESGTARVAETKAAGKAAVAGAESAGAKSIEETTSAARRANLEAKRAALESRRQRGIASKQDIEAATRQAQGEFKTTVGTEAPKLAGAQQNVKALKEGSMGRYLAGGKGMLADIAAVAASGYRPIVGARAGARLAAQLFVHSPTAPDLIAAASHSSQTSQLVAKALTGQLAGPKVMMLARALGKATLRAPRASSQGTQRERQEAAAQEEEPQAVNQ